MKSEFGIYFDLTLHVFAYSKHSRPSYIFCHVYDFFCFTSHNISLASINACNNNTHWEVFRKATVQEITLRRRGNTQKTTCVFLTLICVACVTLRHFQGLKQWYAFVASGLNLILHSAAFVAAHGFREIS